MDIRKFFSESDKTEIQQAIADAELNTSGEIRVHIDRYCKEDPQTTAEKVFYQLEMHQTALRNGVLFYVAVDDKKFAIIGDQGINATVPDNFWNTIRDEMLKHFRQKEFKTGLCKGIHMAGEKLKSHFPYQEDDENELSNDISFQE